MITRPDYADKQYLRDPSATRADLIVIVGIAIVLAVLMLMDWIKT